MPIKRIQELYSCGGQKQFTDPDILSYLGKAEIDDYENILLRLDELAWNRLKEKAKSKVFTDDKIKGLQEFFELINEAIGYIYLKDSGCSNIEFPPEGSNATPDLSADCNGRKTYLEVKTINRSEDNDKIIYTNTCEAIPKDDQDWPGPTATDVIQEIPEPLCEKTIRTAEKAKRQLTSPSSESDSRKIMLLFLNADFECRFNKEVKLAFENDMRFLLGEEIELVVKWRCFD